MWSLKKICGCIAASMFSLSYYIAVIYASTLIFYLFVNPRSIFVWVSAIPFVLSILIPPIQSPFILKSKFLGSMLEYFDYQEILESSPSEILEIQKQKKIIFAAQPHGVLSYCGLCHGVSSAKQGHSPVPTAAASVVLKIPVVKHLIGLYGLVDASKSSLTRCLKKTSVVVYVGGIAELFLASKEEEKLHLKERKGFIKLALTTGSEVIPYYFMGNTGGLKVFRGNFLSLLSRKLGVSLTWTYGLLGLPIPLPDKMLTIRGKPLGLPHITEPTNEDIDFWHEKYVAEVIRLFDTYKVGHPDYAHKQLIIE